ncbi:MAG: SAF domain-containing protein, partial [Acetobacteraceae bacterium]
CIASRALASLPSAMAAAIARCSACVSSTLPVSGEVIGNHRRTERHPTVYARQGLVTEVTGRAKRALQAGEIIDGLGGAMLYGSNDLHEAARAKRQVPMCLLPGARLLRDVPKDTVITAEMVALDTATTIYHLRALQDGGQAHGGAARMAEENPRAPRLEAAI